MPLDPCKGPTGIACDKASNRIFSGCNGTSVVVDPNTGKVVATIKNGTRVDALGWDPAKKLIYIPNGCEGKVTGHRVQSWHLGLSSLSSRVIKRSSDET